MRRPTGVRVTDHQCVPSATARPEVLGRVGNAPIPDAPAGEGPALLDNHGGGFRRRDEIDKKKIKESHDDRVEIINKEYA